MLSSLKTYIGLHVYDTALQDGKVVSGMQGVRLQVVTHWFITYLLAFNMRGVPYDSTADLTAAVSSTPQKSATGTPAL